MFVLLIFAVRAILLQITTPSLRASAHTGMAIRQPKENLHISVEVLCLRYLFSRPVTRQVSSAYMCLTSVFGMGTGGPT